MYTIGEFARLNQVSVKTLRYYDEIGLLRPAHVERTTGYRSYEAAQCGTINRIRVLKDLGFSPTDIRRLIAERVSVEEMHALVQQKHDELERRLDRERTRMARAAARLALLEQNDTAACDVAIRLAGPELVASVRETIASHDESARLFEELDRHAGVPAEPRRRGAIWHACADGVIDCEAFVVLSVRVGENGRIRVRELGAQPVASLVYHGDSDYMPSYRAIRAWLSATGVEIAGAKRELYLDDRGGNESVTEIQFPIQLSTAS